MRLPFAPVRQALESYFAKKGASVAGANIAAAQAGHDFALANFRQSVFTMETAPARQDLLLNGNEALALGAIQAGCKFFSAYPMSPSTGVMETMARYADGHGIIVEQAEDEIAAVNMVIGASFAGARAMTATSGGGFALMAEGLSLAAMTETPLVMVDAQRPGPATGFPTRTEQADLNFIIHAGHGEFARAIYTPGTAEEAFFLIQKAFDVAEKFQVPVIIMTDQHLADSVRNIDPENLDFLKINRHLVPKVESEDTSAYKRYQFTPSGISPRAIPSRITEVIYADSDEHTEEGHITEDAGLRVKMVEKRLSLKMELLKKEIVPPEAHNTENAKTLLIGFGSTYGAIFEAVKRLNNPEIGFIHLPQVWPFPATALAALIKKKVRLITVENNAGGQLAGLIRHETGIIPEKSILKFDGRPFDPDLLVREIHKAAK
jgi:2-oxoglutarate ferredoxin oxidoreductase subunit alpha